MDFENIFIGGISGKFAIKLLFMIPLTESVSLQYLVKHECCKLVCFVCAKPVGDTVYLWTCDLRLWSYGYHICFVIM